MKGDHRRRSSVCAPRASTQRSDRAVREDGRDVQGRDHRQAPPDAVVVSTRPASGSTSAADRTSRRPTQIGAFKLMSVAGAYWRGDSRNPDAPAHLRHRVLRQGRARRVPAPPRGGEARDHRKLGKELDLFMFHPVAPAPRSGPPAAPSIFTTLSTVMRRSASTNGYQEIKTPLLYNKGLWEIERPLGQVPREHVPGPRQRDRRARLLAQADELPVALPLLRDEEALLPRAAAALHTYGRAAPQRGSGALSGLTRVRQFQQDDAHIFCMEDQIAEEVARLSEAHPRSTTRSDSSTPLKFATRPERIGDDALWDRAESLLAARSMRRAPVRDQARRRRVLRAEDRLRRRRTRSAASGSSARSSSTTTRRSAST